MEKRFKTLLESQMGDVKPLISEQEVEEGSTWEGVKGFFKGKGYKYSKYLAEIETLISKLRRKVTTDDRLRSEMDELINEITGSNVEDTKKDELLNHLQRISDIVENANEELRDHLSFIIKNK
jgi:seryl-tRNA synthetase